MLAPPLLFLAMTVRPESERGELLYRQCQAYNLPHPSPYQIDRGNMCVSYIEGFADGRGPAYKFGCFLGVSGQSMVDAYLKWMKSHSEYMRMSKRLGVDAALDKAFCYYYEPPPANK